MKEAYKELEDRKIVYTYMFNMISFILAISSLISSVIMYRNVDKGIFSTISLLLAMCASAFFGQLSSKSIEDFIGTKFYIIWTAYIVAQDLLYSFDYLILLLFIILVLKSRYSYNIKFVKNTELYLILIIAITSYL